MARAMWSGAISFGLVNIPVKLYPAARDKEVHFHQLHKKDMARIQYRLWCPDEDKEVPREDVLKGYQLGPDQYVIVTPKELESVAPEKSRRIDIVAFVDLAEIDPVYYEHPYWLLPDEAAAKAYRLLTEAMSQEGKVAVARMVLRNREYLAALRVVDHALCLHSLRFANEVVLPKDLEGVPDKVQVNDKEVQMARQLMNTLAEKFEPQKYHDEYQERLQQMIEKKAQGEEVVTQPAAPRPGRVVNLMAALEESLKTARQKAAQPAEHRKPRRKTA